MSEVDEDPPIRKRQKFKSREADASPYDEDSNEVVSFLLAESVV